MGPSSSIAPMSFIKKILKAVVFTTVCFLVGSVLLGLFFWTTFSDDAPEIGQPVLLLVLGLFLLLAPLILGYFVVKQTIAELIVMLLGALLAGLALTIGVGLVYVLISD